MDEVGDASDDAAYATMKAVLDAGLRIPDDVAIVGAGNIRHADFLRVPLTTIDQNSVAMGERAAKLALGLIEGDGKGGQGAKTVLMEPRLVMRSSSMRIPR